MAFWKLGLVDVVGLTRFESFLASLGEDGSTTVLTQDELNKRLNPKMKMIEREDNQWWDVLDRFPDKVKYIDVYNAASDFDIDEDLKRLQKIDPERYSNTEIRIQPVYIDPD